MGLRSKPNKVNILQLNLLILNNRSVAQERNSVEKTKKAIKFQLAKKIKKIQKQKNAHKQELNAYRRLISSDISTLIA